MTSYFFCTLYIWENCIALILFSVNFTFLKHFFLWSFTLDKYFKYLDITVGTQLWHGISAVLKHSLSKTPGWPWYPRVTVQYTVCVSWLTFFLLISWTSQTNMPQYYRLTYLLLFSQAVRLWRQGETKISVPCPRGTLIRVATEKECQSQRTESPSLMWDNRLYLVVVVL